MKKILSKLLLIVFTLNITSPIVFAENKLTNILPIHKQNGVYVDRGEQIISSKIEKDLRDEIELGSFWPTCVPIS